MDFLHLLENLFNALSNYDSRASSGACSKGATAKKMN